MGLSLLERYVFRKALVAMLTTSAALIGVIWVVRAIQQVDVILSKGQGIATYLQMTSLGVPTLAAAIAPLALMLALLQTINTLNNDSELVVMHASGASRLSLAKPFLLLSLLTSILVYIIALYAAPNAMVKLRTYITQVRADLISVIVREGAFADVGQSLTFHVAARAPGGRLKGVFILDGRNPKETLTYLAREGDVAKIDKRTFLLLQDGEIQRKNNDSGNLSVIKYESYGFDLSNFAGKPSSDIGSQSEASTWYLMFPDPSHPFYANYPDRVRAEFHKRFTVGLYPLMVGFLVLIFVGTPATHRQGQTVVVAAAASTIVLLRVVTIIAEGGLRENPWLAFVTWGVPLAAIAYAIYSLVTDTSPINRRTQNRIERLLQTSAERVRYVWDRVLGRKPSASGGAA